MLGRVYSAVCICPVHSVLRIALSYDYIYYNTNLGCKAVVCVAKLLYLFHNGVVLYVRVNVCVCVSSKDREWKLWAYSRIENVNYQQNRDQIVELGSGNWIATAVHHCGK